jgi:hypothetical protein
MGRPTSLLAHYLFLTSRRPNPCFLLRGPSPRTAARAWPAALRDPLASCDRSAPRRAFHWRFTDLWGPSVIRSDRFFPNDVRGPCGRIAGFRLKRWSSGIKLTLRLSSSLSLYCTPTPRPPLQPLHTELRHREKSEIRRCDTSLVPARGRSCDCQRVVRGRMNQFA